MTTTARVQAHLKTCDIGHANADLCASALAMSSSVLFRRLKSDGVKFSTLLDAERQARCEALYSRHKRPDAALVMRVTGFRGTSSITRAMQRWYSASLIDMRAG